MTKRCVCCRSNVFLSKNDSKCLDQSGPFVCSLACVKSWVVSNFARLDPFKLNGRDRRVVRVDLGPPNDGGVYSRILNQWFRSSFERNIAECLYCAGLEFEYEKVGFKWSTKVYTPDFYFPEYRGFVEVKGLWGCSVRSKYSNFRQVFPEVGLLVVPWTLEAEARSKSAIYRGPCYFGGCVK